MSYHTRWFFLCSVTQVSSGSSRELFFSFHGFWISDMDLKKGLEMSAQKMVEAVGEAFSLCHLWFFFRILFVVCFVHSHLLFPAEKSTGFLFIHLSAVEDAANWQCTFRRHKGLLELKERWVGDCLFCFLGILSVEWASARIRKELLLSGFFLSGFFNLTALG